MNAPRERVAVWLAYAGMCLIWGTTWLAIKIGLQGMGPMTGVGVRFLLAGTLLFVVALVRGEARPLRALPWKLIALMATLMFSINYVLNYVAETQLSSGLVAVLFGTLPFFTFGFSQVMLGERTTPRIWLGSLAAFAGVAVISLVSAEGSPLYALAAVGAAATAALGNVVAKKYVHEPPLVTLPPAMALAGAVVLVCGLVFERTDWPHALSGSSLAALLYLAVFGSGIAFFLLMWVLKRISAGAVGLSTLIFPVIAVVVGTLFGGEHFTLRELLGSALVVVGLSVALTRSDAARAAQTETVPEKTAAATS